MEPLMNASRRSPIAVGVIICLALLLATSTAFGHATVYPRTSEPGSYEKYVLRVPNERDVPTVRVEIRFPAALRVVSFSDVPGWQLRMMKDTAQRITGAVWNGVLPPERFIEFPFVAVNPKESTTLSWPTIQTYENGERVEWTGPDSSNTPAAITSVGSLSSAAPSRLPLYLSAIALVVSIISLGLGAKLRL
jgi:uncharacterized protein YcnI